MKALLRALKAIYDFFAGDAIILAFVGVGFVGAGLLLKLAGASVGVGAAVLVGLVTVGLVTTLAREARGK
ncbi:MAG TPA: hypothetical protein VL359_07515 [bacterium]|nr:hypothetical protein [bacterium]